MEKHHAKRSPIFRPRLRQIMEHGAAAGVLVNICLIPLFWISEIYFLALFSIGSALLYVACLGLLRRNHVDLVVLLTFLEILVHVPVVVVIIGWDGGFQYYLLVLLPLVFVAAPRRPQVTTTLAAILCAVFIGLDYYVRRQPPTMALDSGVLTYIRFGNILSAFGLSAYVAWRYSLMVLHAEKALARAANTDPLSGLSNRRHVNELIQREILRGERDNVPLSFILIDIDNFKAVNDQYGHEAGDQLIGMTAKLLESGLRGPDMVARWGGEEFLAVLPDTDIGNAKQVAERLRHAISQHPLRTEAGEIAVTATFGVSEFHRGESLERCIDRADQALYRGKHDGKNVVRSLSLKR